MAKKRMHEKDILKMVVAVIFGKSTYGLAKASGLFSNLAAELGGSEPAAYLILMIACALILLWGW